MPNPKFQLERTCAPVSDEEMISDIQRVAKIGGTNRVSFRRYAEFGLFSPQTATVRFGSWNRALVIAGLQVASERDITDERLFENLMRLWEHYGRQPRFRDLGAPPSVISHGPYIRRFRSWMKALEQFVAYANGKDAQIPIPTESSVPRSKQRDPSLRLRFRVMKRDSFSCRACGASPALRAGLVLHVDHIKAWSEGGETVEANLQTLCEPCNLGKSNVL